VLYGVCLQPSQLNKQFVRNNNVRIPVLSIAEIPQDCQTVKHLFRMGANDCQGLEQAAMT